MSKGGWLFLIAIGGLAYAQDAPVVLLNDAVLVCDETGCRERLNKEAEQQGDGAGEQQSAPNESNVSEPAHQASIAYAPETDAPSKRAEERAEEDLDAQKAMADWAQGMFWATLFGVVLIGITLRQSWRAAKFASDTLGETTRLGTLHLNEAENATKAAIDTTNETIRLGDLNLAEAKNATAAANETVKVTREMGRAQSRAYLTISTAQFRFIPESSYPTIKFTVLNSGQTPAKQISVIYGVNYAPDGAPLPHSNLRIKELTDFGGGEAGEIELEMPWAVMPQGYFEKWMKGEEVPVFEGWFRFRDVFNDRWKVPFQFEAFHEDFDGDWNYSPLGVPAWRLPILGSGKEQ